MRFPLHGQSQLTTILLTGASITDSTTLLIGPTGCSSGMAFLPALVRPAYSGLFPR